jgi:hypothetical protein
LFLLVQEVDASPAASRHGIELRICQPLAPLFPTLQLWRRFFKFSVQNVVFGEETSVLRRWVGGFQERRNGVPERDKRVVIRFKTTRNMQIALVALHIMTIEMTAMSNVTLHGVLLVGLPQQDVML